MPEIVFINNEEVTPQVVVTDRKSSGFYKVTDATLRLDDSVSPVVDGTWVEITEEEYRDLVEEQAGG